MSQHRELSKASQGKRVWSARDAEDAESESETEEEEDIIASNSSSSDTEPGVQHVVPPVQPSMIVFGSGAASQYDRVVHTGVVHPTIVFPLDSAEKYATVEYVIKHSDKRSTVHRARAVTVMTADGGLEHHVIETIAHERKAIEALFAAKQIGAVDIAKRVNTKNTARNALACIKNGQWDIQASKNRESYKKLMTIGFGPCPVLIFGTFYAKSLIKADDEPPVAKRPKHAQLPTANPIGQAPVMAPELCQNMVWVDELEAMLGRAPAGMEKKFTSAMFNLLRTEM
jgi:hypothetical protein